MYKKTLVCGDIHSNWKSLEKLINTYSPYNHDYIFLGDFSDYREENPKENSNYVKVIQEIRRIVRAYNGVALLGNHDDKLIRHLKGNKVEIKEGFDNTLYDLDQCFSDTKEQIKEFLNTLPLIYSKIINGITYQFAHAYYPQDQEIFSRAMTSTPREWKTFKEHCIWGVPRRLNQETGKQERVFFWLEDKYRNRIPGNTVKIFGHYHTIYKDDKFICLDSTPKIEIYIIEDDKLEIF